MARKGFPLTGSGDDSQPQAQGGGRPFFGEKFAASTRGPDARISTKLFGFVPVFSGWSRVFPGVPGWFLVCVAVCGDVRGLLSGAVQGMVGVVATTLRVSGAGAGVILHSGRRRRRMRCVCGTRHRGCCGCAGEVTFGAGVDPQTVANDQMATGEFSPVGDERKVFGPDRKITGS